MFKFEVCSFLYDLMLIRWFATTLEQEEDDETSMLNCSGENYKCSK